MANELFAVDQAVASVLVADASLISAMGGTLEIDTVIEPEGRVSGKYVVIQYPDSEDTNAMGGRHVITRPMVIVFVCGVGCDIQDLKAPSNIITDLLTQGPITIDGVYVGKFIKERTMFDADINKGTRINYVQMVFRLVAFQAP